MMIIGTFFDLSISKALYDQNNIFGNILAAFGEYPSSLGFVASGTMIIIGRNKEHKVKNILQIILGIWFIISGSLMAAMLPTNYLDIPSILSIIIGLTCSILTILLITKLAKNTDRQTIIKLASVFIIVIFANIIIINIIKIPWGRARYRLVAVNDQAYFMPWYQPGTTLKDTLVAQGVLKEEFKEFHVTDKELKQAIDKAYDELKQCQLDIRQEGQKALQYMREHHLQGIVLAGRPYHVDPEINHGIADLITSEGFVVLTEDSVCYLDQEHLKLRVVDQWTYHSR